MTAFFYELDGEDITRERAREIYKAACEEAARIFEEKMRPALDHILDDADEHGLSVDEVRATWTAGLGIFLSSREPRACENCGRPGCRGVCG